MTFSYATVVDALQLTPRMRRISLRVDDPAALNVQRAGDSAVGVYFPVATGDGERLPPPPAPGTDGRTYSVRRHDGDRIDIDVVLHSRGPGTAWATATSAGDRIGLDHARSWYRPAPGTDWQLLVADLAGLPAAARIVEELPAGVSCTAVVEVADRDDLDYLPSHPDVTVLATVGSGNGDAPSQLARMVRELAVPDGRGYCWFAGEAAESRAVRKHFRARGWTVDQLDVSGYWRLGSETWDARFALVEDDVVTVYARALADGKGDKVAAEEFDEALERVGL